MVSTCSLKTWYKIVIVSGAATSVASPFNEQLLFIFSRTYFRSYLVPSAVISINNIKNENS